MIIILYSFIFLKIFKIIDVKTNKKNSPKLSWDTAPAKLAISIDDKFLILKSIDV